MKISRALLISAFITAVILVVAGTGVSTALARRDNANREAEYNQLIEQANQQIEQANADLARMQNQIAQAQPTAQMAQAAADIPAAAEISAGRAAAIAREAADPLQSMQKDPEMVDFQGKAAYEVAFDNGAVYIDAATGEVLFNGTLPQKIDADMAAKVASDYLGDKNILSVDTVTFRDQELFRVIFKNGTMVYMDETGQITYINKGVVVMADDSSGGNDGYSGGGYSGSGGHDDDDDHGDDHGDDYEDD